MNERTRTLTPRTDEFVHKLINRMEPAVYHGPLESFWPPEGWVRKLAYDRLRGQLDAAGRERDERVAEVRQMHAAFAKAESELGAVRKRTIEECARVAENFVGGNPYPTGRDAIAAAIRSLPLTGSEEGEKNG